MSNEITGKIFLIKDTEKVSDKFQKREFVIVTDQKYPQYIPFQCVNDKCSILSSFSEGQTVTVKYNLRGTKWNSASGETKYFVSLEAWQIGAFLDTTKPEAQENNGDDLPF